MPWLIDRLFVLWYVANPVCRVVESLHVGHKASEQEMPALRKRFLALGNYVAGVSMAGLQG